MSEKDTTQTRVGHPVKNFIGVPEFFVGTIILGMMIGTLTSVYFNYIH